MDKYCETNILNIIWNTNLIMCTSNRACSRTHTHTQYKALGNSSYIKTKHKLRTVHSPANTKWYEPFQPISILIALHVLCLRVSIRKNKWQQMFIAGPTTKFMLLLLLLLLVLLETWDMLIIAAYYCFLWLWCNT